MSKKIWIAATIALACGAGLAKLPVPVLDDAAKAKAAETAAKTAWASKVDAFLLCRAQDRTAAYYRSHAGVRAVKVSAVAAAAPGVPAPKPAASAVALSSTAGTAAAGATAGGPTGAGPIAPGSKVAANPAVPGGTAAKPAGPATPTGCADPGPFTVNVVAERPLEASGAHSPAGTAASPPSSRATSAEMAPAKK